MTRTMYDGVTVSNIPNGAKMVAGYVDGHYANIPALKKRFPNSRVVTIAVSSKTRAMVLDVETGDATPQSAITWCTHTMADHDNTNLTIYCNSSTWPQVKAAFKSAGVTLPQWWEAHYDGVAKLSPGAIAKQYANNARYDTSVVADYWPGVDPKPTTPTHNTKDDTMSTTQDLVNNMMHIGVIGTGGKGDVTSKREQHSAGWFLATLLNEIRALRGEVDALKAKS